MIHHVAQWMRDAWLTGLDVLVAGLAVTGAVMLQLRWPAVVAGVWSVLALRQARLTARECRRGPDRFP
ncbi:hypothetical protein [Streptomyces shenzhenensis]|uniref:hypothetical protein n=1 Tax=Streptomyces shenzhenensis TaxID=943815 RepID=UPI0015F0EA99|nr:hypothetical protein [Streptomyces shenzhenensis]